MPIQVIEYDIPRYCAAEQDLCKLHAVSSDDEHIDSEIKQIQESFAQRYPHLNGFDPHRNRDCDYEFPDWHHNLRLFWVYLYHDGFYSDDFIPFVQKLLSSPSRGWIAEFECYSPSLKSNDLPSGSIGQFLVYMDTVMFCQDDKWALFKSKLGL